MAKILIVDDDKSVQLLVQRLLSENGHTVSTAMSELAALQLFQTQSFDLIITDPRSPSMRGMFFLNEVKKLEPEKPVIIVTTYYAPTGVPIETMKDRASFFLTKPFKGYELMEKVNLALRHNNLRPQPINRAARTAAPSRQETRRPRPQPTRPAERAPVTLPTLGHLTGTLGYCPG